MFKSYRTNRLTLRTMAPNEAAKSLSFYERNKDFLAPFEPIRNNNFYTLEHHQRVLRLEEEDMANLKSLRLWLYLQSDISCERPIGTIALSNIIRGIFQSCFLGYKMDETYLRRGYMNEAITKIIQIAFSDYKLHRIEANIMPNNLPSMNLVKKIGFEEEGIAKSYLKINGKWEDHAHMVLLNDRV